jgi:transposase
MVKYNQRKDDYMKPISNEKRELLVAAKGRGEKEEDIAKWLRVSKGSVGTIWRLFRQTGSFLPTAYTGRISVMTSEKIGEICDTVKENPDITLSELIEELSLPIQKSQLSRLLIAQGYSFKKRVLIRPSRAARISKRNAERSKS